MYERSKFGSGDRLISTHNKYGQNYHFDPRSCLSFIPNEDADDPKTHIGQLFAIACGEGLFDLVEAMLFDKRVDSSADDSLSIQHNGQNMTIYVDGQRITYSLLRNHFIFNKMKLYFESDELL